MIFLIEYNRSEGRMVSPPHVFDESEREKAREARLNLELDLNRKGIDHEVVLLEALSEAALRKTHRRYFESLSEIGKSFGDLAK